LLLLGWPEAANRIALHFVQGTDRLEDVSDSRQDQAVRWIASVDAERRRACALRTVEDAFAKRISSSKLCGRDEIKIEMFTIFDKFASECYFASFAAGLPCDLLR